MLWWGAVASGAEPACVPLTDGEVALAAARVRAELPAGDAHDAMFRDLLSRLTCSDPALAESAWVKLVLAEAHVHHLAAEAAPTVAPAALAIPIVGPESPADAPPGEPAEPAAPEPLEPGPPAAADEGRSAWIRVHSPLSVRLFGWTGTYRGGRVPAGRYIVAPRVPPGFEAIGAIAVYAAADEVWSVRCDRAGACDAVRVGP